MHVRRSRLVVVASVAALTTLSLAGPALAHDDGDFDIQKAVDDAEPGDTIDIPSGTYEQSVTITKDGISLRGDDVVIDASTADPTDCDTLGAPASPPPDASGICILGSVDEKTFEVTERVSDVSISGITVKNAPAHGLIAFGTEELSVRDSRFEDNGGYGAASFDTEGTTFRDNVATDNGEAGFYVGDSPESDADVSGNHSARNLEGFLFRNVSHGKAHGNVAEGNCLGILLLAGAPGPATDWEVRDNEVEDNNKACEADADDGAPALSRAGIVVVGAQEFEVRENRVSGHDSDAESPVKGGIVVISSSAIPGLAPFTPSGDVEDNRLSDNAPADLVWDETGQVDFDDNRCATSETFAGAELDLCDDGS
jgi:hypothetical protein